MIRNRHMAFVVPRVCPMPQRGPEVPQRKTRKTGVSSAKYIAWAWQYPWDSAWCKLSTIPEVYQQRRYMSKPNVYMTLPWLILCEICLPFKSLGGYPGNNHDYQDHRTPDACCIREKKTTENNIQIGMGQSWSSSLCSEKYAYQWDNGSTMGLDLNLAEQLKPIPFLWKQSNHYSAMLNTRGKHLLYGQKQKIL